MIQSMACGLPVVAARAGGLVEYVEDGRTGFLADAGDPQAFVSPILSLLRDRDIRSRMSAEALLAVTRFDTGSIAVQVEKIYSFLLCAEQERDAEGVSLSKYN